MFLEEFRMGELVFYDRSGKPICYRSEKDNETLYLFNGTPVAYIYDTSVYSFRGRHLGWFENGWVYDNNGYCVFFTQDAYGGPAKPIKRVTPIKHATRIKPVKSIKAVRPIRPVKRLQWGDSDDFFD